MRVLAVVPARGGSKRVKRKNLQLLGGVPLVVLAAEDGRQAACVSRLVVSSEDSEILDAVRAVDPDMALERPVSLASDTSPVIDSVRHALEVLENGGDERYDAVVVLHPTSPLRHSADIDHTVELMVASGASSAVSVVRVNHMIHPLKLKVMDGDLLVPFLEDEAGRRMAHELPDVYVRNCAVYAATRGLVDGGELIGDDCVGYVMPAERSVDINDETDLELARLLWSRRE
jgi:CMP-N,N'-diacetyllegionaminic acid synthase